MEFDFISADLRLRLERLSDSGTSVDDLENRGDVDALVGDDSSDDSMVYFGAHLANSMLINKDVPPGTYQLSVELGHQDPSSFVQCTTVGLMIQLEELMFAPSPTVLFFSGCFSSSRLTLSFFIFSILSRIRRVRLKTLRFFTSMCSFISLLTPFLFPSDY